MKATFENALLVLVTAFGGEVDEVTTMVYRGLLRDIAPDVLFAGVNRLIKAAAAGQKFYPMPKPHDWIRACQDEIKQRRKEALQALGDCTLCDGTRWVTVTLNGVECLTRCECWRIRQQVADAAGKLLALPPKKDDDE